MSDSVYVGNRSATLETSPAFEGISKIVIYVDDENVYEAGNDNGRTLELTCPYGTQAMANNLLNELGGYAYQPMQASDALMDPAAELGDAVTIGGVYTILASADTTFDQLMAADIGAPGQEEIESEYPYTSRQQTEQQRQLAQVRSEISKNASEISLRVDGLENDYTQLSVTLDGVTVAGPGGTTLIKGSSIQTSTLAANSISASAVNLTGAITFGDLSTSVQNDINDAYSMAEDAQTAVGDISDTVDDWSYRYGGSTYIDGTKIMAGTVTASTLQGGSVELLNSSGGTAGMMYLRSASSASYAVGIDSYGAMSLEASGTLHLSGDGVIIDLGDNYIGCGKTLRPAGDDAYDVGTSSWRWSTIYAATPTISTSDRSEKTDINYDISAYDAIFDALKPASFRYVNGTSGRTHTGFISQDIEDALESCGLTSTQFATFIKSPQDDGGYRYGLRYEELIALCVKQIQALKRRVTELEAS